MILNQRPNEVEFYNTILYSTHDILVKGVDNDDAQIKVDKEDLEEAEAAVAFAKKTRVFDKPPSVDKTLQLLKFQNHLSHNLFWIS